MGCLLQEKSCHKHKHVLRKSTQVTNAYLKTPTKPPLIYFLSRNLKYVFMHGKKVMRMDETISIVMKPAFNMQYERIIRLEKGYLPRKLSELRQRHKLASNESSNIQNVLIMIKNTLLFHLMVMIFILLNFWRKLSLVIV